MPEPFRVLTSRTVVLTEQNIDTDQIIPARFLTTTTRQGLGRLAFHDWRYDATGAPRPDFVLNRIDPAEHRILVTGRNFGCGSSREHAPWALEDFGFRAVISTEIADIFTSNALQNGLLPITVDEATHARLTAAPGEPVTVDLEACTLSGSDWSARFPIDGFARRRLLDGVDTLGWLLNREGSIRAFEAHRAS